ncbi:MAG TPA: DUF6691 family protein [Polyangia bacterium]|nr:DUF6691 family protein [Polyangia bacterium]
MSRRWVGLVFGVAFGFWLAWARLTDYRAIVGALRFQSFYLWLLFATGVATTALGLQILSRTGARTWLTRAPLAWPPVSPQRRHVVGSALFGVGGALAGACPGPIAAQIGEGRLSALFTLAGLLAGIAVADTLGKRQPLFVGAPCAGEAQEARG